MMCDKCVKKSVCKLYDGSNIQGCIEFYRPHEKVLQELQNEIEERINNCGDGNFKDGLCEAFDIIYTKIKELSE